MAVDRSSQRPKRWAAVDRTEGIAAHRPPAIPSFPQRRLSPKCQLTERPLPKHTFRSGLTVSAIPPKMGRAARNRTIRHSISNHAVAPLSLTRAYGVRPCKLNSPASWFQWQPSHSPMQLFHALSVFHDWPFPGNDCAAATAPLQLRSYTTSYLRPVRARGEAESVSSVGSRRQPPRSGNSCHLNHRRMFRRALSEL